MAKYENSVIYKIIKKGEKDESNIYVGSTKNFSARKSKHKSTCQEKDTKKSKYKLYQIINNNGGWDNYNMEIIEEYSCSCKIDLEKREKYWIDKIKSKINDKIPTRERKEYEKSEKRKESYKQREKSEKRKEWYKSRYEKNKEEKIEKSIQHYYDNKDEINFKRNEKITCECGCIVNKGNIAVHKRTGKHIKLMENKNVSNN